MSDELELGIAVPPPRPVRGVAPGYESDPEGKQLPRVGYAWDKIRGSRIHCSVCFDRAPKDGGTLKGKVPWATMVRRDARAILYLCATHGSALRTGDDVTRARR